MSRNTPEIYEVLVSGLPSQYPDEPLSPAVWEKINLPRPCFDQMMASVKIDAGSRPDLMVYALAKELFRRGLNAPAIEKICIHFSNNNLKERIYASQVRSILRDYLKNDHYHACDHWVLQRFCVGSEKCAWVKASKHQEHKTESDLEKFESLYSRLLRLPVRTVYKYFVDLEQKLRLRPGQPIQRSYRQITADLKFTDKGIVQRACLKLQEFGLIKIVFTGWQGKEATGFASIFSRVSPIPPPRIKPKEVACVNQIQSETQLS